jgi:hypothetical protein
VLFLFVQQSLSAIDSVATVFLPPAATENRRHLLNRSVNTDSPTLSCIQCALRSTIVTGDDSCISVGCPDCYKGFKAYKRCDPVTGLGHVKREINSPITFPFLLILGRPFEKFQKKKEIEALPVNYLNIMEAEDTSCWYDACCW